MSLFELMKPAVRKTDPDTSKKAADAIKFDSIRRSILFVLENANASGLATFELARELSLPRDYVSPHFKPMERLGLVERTGEHRTNPATNNKTECEVWRVTPRYYELFAKRRQDISWRTIHTDRVARLLKEIETCKEQLASIAQRYMTYSPSAHELVNVPCKLSPLGHHVYIDCVYYEVRHKYRHCHFCGLVEINKENK